MSQMKQSKRRLGPLGVVLALALAGIIAILYAAGVLFSAVDRPSSPQLLSAAERAEAKTYFIRLAEDINRHHYELELIYDHAIYQGAYLMRTLVAAYEITGREDFLQTALRFADELVKLQRKDGYWVVADHGNIYLADTGSALGLIMILYKHVDEQRQALYFQTIKKYADAVIHDGLIYESGALDAGYQLGKDGSIEKTLGPYTIATELTGVVVFTWLYLMSGDRQYKEIAMNALTWLLKWVRDDGEIAYIFPGRGADPALQHDPESYSEVWEKHRFGGASAYFGEAIIVAYVFLADHTSKSKIEGCLEKHFDLLLRNQNEDGTWGTNQGQRERSPGIINLLSWWYRNIQEDARLPQAVERLVKFILTSGSEELRVMKPEAPDRSTGFIGRALAELIKPGVDYDW
jgi:hypothetical protein